MTTRSAGAVAGPETEYSKLKNSSSSSSSDDGLSQVVVPVPTVGVRRVKRLRRRKDYDCLKQRPPPKPACVTLSTCGTLCAGVIVFAALVGLGAFHYRLSQQVANLQSQVTARDAVALAELREKVLSVETLFRQLSLNVSTLGATLLNCGRTGGSSRRGEDSSQSTASAAPGELSHGLSIDAGGGERPTAPAPSSAVPLLVKRLADLERAVDAYGVWLNGAIARPLIGGEAAALDG